MKARVKVELDSVELKALSVVRKMREKLEYDKENEYWQISLVLSTFNIQTCCSKSMAACHVEPGVDGRDEVVLDHIELQKLKARVEYLEVDVAERMKALGMSEPVAPSGDTTEQDAVH